MKKSNGITRISLILLIILVISVLSLLSLIIYTAVKGSNDSNYSDDNEKTILGNLNITNKNNAVTKPSNSIDNNINSSNIINNSIDDNNIVDNQPNNDDNFSGTPKSSSSFTLDNTTLTFNVPSGFRSYNKSEYSSMVSELFTDSTGFITISVAMSDNTYSSISEDIKVEAESYSYQPNFKASDIQSIDVNGKDFKYIELSYTLDSSFDSEDIYVKEIYIVCDISNNKRFTIRADTAFADEVDLSINTIREFLQISGV